MNKLYNSINAKIPTLMAKTLTQTIRPKVWCEWHILQKRIHVHRLRRRGDRGWLKASFSIYKWNCVGWCWPETVGKSFLVSHFHEEENCPSLILKSNSTNLHSKLFIRQYWIQVLISLLQPFDSCHISCSFQSNLKFYANLMILFHLVFLPLNYWWYSNKMLPIKYIRCGALTFPSKWLTFSVLFFSKLIQSEILQLI